MKYLICKTCGKIVSTVKETKVPTVCCGAPMQELVAGTTDASVEKHVPVYTVSGYRVIVNVGAVSHPMTEEHFIEWITIVTNKGVQTKNLQPNIKPSVEFALTDSEKVLEVYAYCNLHSLWKA
ncbi:MAG: desulfoferrodoxin [Clostridia bacterium]|nr:desulfoferrodoxin [Clostridia bacterium]